MRVVEWECDLGGMGMGQAEVRGVEMRLEWEGKDGGRETRLCIQCPCYSSIPGLLLYQPLSTP